VKGVETQVIVVIPSCRSINTQYLKSLIEYGARFIVIDDSEGSIKINHPQFEVYNWSDRKRLLGRNEIAIPRKNGACRDLGFYIAWKQGETDEIIVAIDDDCVIESKDFGKQVESKLSQGVRRTAHGKGQHINIFDLYRNVDSTKLFPRGFPYSARVSYEPWRFDDKVSGQVHFNLGLWREVFDINAIDKIRLDQTIFPDAELIHENVVIPQGKLISVCSGNMQFRRELIPAVYQLPMNIEVMPNWAIDRYGDIWAGFILKTLMDIRGDQMSVGAPMVRHLREEPYQNNIVKEHLGHMVNEEFIELLLQSSSQIRPGSYLDMMRHLREELSRNAVNSSLILRAYLQHLDTSLVAWLEALGS